MAWWASHSHVDRFSSTDWAVKQQLSTNCGWRRQNKGAESIPLALTGPCRRLTPTAVRRQRASPLRERLASRFCSAKPWYLSIGCSARTGSVIYEQLCFSFLLKFLLAEPNESCIRILWLFLIGNPLAPIVLQCVNIPARSNFLYFLVGFC